MPDGKIIGSGYKFPQVHMNTELTVISGNSPNVCRDLRALVWQASEGQDEFAPAARVVRQDTIAVRTFLSILEH